MSPISSTSGTKNSSISAATLSIRMIRLSALRVPVLGRVLDEVVADRDDDVGVLEPGHRVVARLQADGSQRVGILVVEQPLGHERLGRGDPGRTDEVAKRAAGVGADGAVADEGDRVLGGSDDLGRALELADAGLGLDGVMAGQRRGVERPRHHVLGQLQVGRSRLLRLRHLEGLPNYLGYDLRTGYARVPLDDRAQNAKQVDVLMGLLVHTLEVGLTGQGDERGAVQERIGDCRDQVGGARAEGPEADTGPPGEPADGVGHVRAALLVAHRDELNRGVGERCA